MSQHNTPTSLKRRLLTGLLTGALLSTSAVAFAQDDPDYVPDEDILAQGDKSEDGWDFTLSIGATVNVSQNDSVVGQPDGTSITLGSKFNFGADYNKGGHEVRSRLDIANTFTQTPVVDEFVRTNDLMTLETIYYYHFESVPWFGPFARLNLQTSIFQGEDVQAETKDYIIRGADGTVENITADRLKLTDPLQPLTLKESAGFFARPLDHRWLSIEFRIGLGAQQIFADGGLAINDNGDTAEIEVDRLVDSSQAGAEAALTATGAAFGKRVTYKAGAESLTPFFSSSDADTDKSAVDLTNVTVYAQLSFKLVSWASLDYEFKAIRQPVLLDEFQIQNNLLLTFGYTLLGDE